MAVEINLRGTSLDIFRIGRNKAVLDASGLTAERTYTLADAGGRLLPAEQIYPVGSVIQRTGDSTNPGDASWLGFGTWEPFAAGQVLLGAGTHTDTRSEQRTFGDGDTGGAFQHVLTEAEMPSHSHGIAVNNGGPGTYGGRLQVTVGSDSLTSDNAGGSQPHDSMQPYLVVHLWKRTA